jgi:hypothetical protein
MFSVLLPILRTYSNEDSWLFRGLNTHVYVYVYPKVVHNSYLDYISTAVVVQLCLQFFVFKFHAAISKSLFLFFIFSFMF